MLINTVITNAKPQGRPYKLTDEKGLYLLVVPSGGKYWRLDYRHAGKRKTLALGVYPEVSLKQAREKRDETRRILADGIDPAALRREKRKIPSPDAVANTVTFRISAEDWYKRKAETWAEATARKAGEGVALLNEQIGDMPIESMRTFHVVDALHKIEKRSPHMAAKCRQFVQAIFRHAIRRGHRPEGSFLDLKDVLKPLPESHFPAFRKTDIPKFLKRLEDYGSIQCRAALKLLLFTFVRPSELVGATWDEVDLDVAIWSIPPERMKMRSAHLVPLARQSVDLLRGLRAVSLRSPFVFPSAYSPATRHMHRDTLSKALREMDFSGIAVPHGFRHFASTQLNEMGFRGDVIERQLAHKDKDAIRAIYNQAQYLDERKEMMQKWADYLDRQTA